LQTTLAPSELSTSCVSGADVLVFSLFWRKLSRPDSWSSPFSTASSLVSLRSPALITLCDHFDEVGIRLGTDFLVTSLAALTSTPDYRELFKIDTALTLRRFGSGVAVLIGSAVAFNTTAQSQRHPEGLKSR